MNEVEVECPVRKRGLGSVVLWIALATGLFLVVAVAIGAGPLLAVIGYSAVVDIAQMGGEERHYRLTTVVHTPQGDRSGSTVFAVRVKTVVDLSGTGNSTEARWRGQGARIDLPNGKYVLQNIKTGLLFYPADDMSRHEVPCDSAGITEMMFDSSGIVSGLGCDKSMDLVSRSYSVTKYIQRTDVRITPLTGTSLPKRVPINILDGGRDYHRSEQRENFYAEEF